MTDSFHSHGTLEVPVEVLGSPAKTWRMARLAALEEAGMDLTRLPFSLRILLENLLRHEDGASVTAEDIQALVDWDPAAKPSREIAFRPARVLMQDFTGVPALVDLAAMRDAIVESTGAEAAADNADFARVLASQRAFSESYALWRRWAYPRD